MSTKTTRAALCLLGSMALTWGCAPKPAADYPPAAAEEAPAPQAPYGPAYSQPPPEPGAGKAQPYPNELDLAERPRTTVEEASGSLDSDEQLLEQLLSQPTVDLQAGLDACRRVCAALGSMQRSVDAICDLSGADDPRCERARQRLEINSRRVDGAGCRC